jgi:hypothetical protein
MMIMRKRRMKPLNGWLKKFLMEFKLRNLLSKISMKKLLSLLASKIKLVK